VSFKNDECETARVYVDRENDHLPVKLGHTLASKRFAEAKESPSQKIDMDTIARSRWYWESTAENFRRAESAAILGQLVVRHPFDVG
jgi:hypothetical protein